MRTALSNYERLQPEDVRTILNEILRGFAVSFLTTIDGGTWLAEHTRISLIDNDGNALGAALHEAFVAHLLSTGRMT